MSDDMLTAFFGDEAAAGIRAQVRPSAEIEAEAIGLVGHEAWETRDRSLALREQLIDLTDRLGGNAHPHATRLYGLSAEASFLA